LTSIGRESARFEMHIKDIKGTSILQQIEKAPDDVSEKQLYLHTEAVMCLDFDVGSQILVSGSGDRSIIVWNLNSLKPQKTLVGHGGWITCCQMEGSSVATGSTDRTVRIWTVDTGKCEKILGGPTAGVCCLQFSNEKVITGDTDAIIRQWNAETANITLEMKGHSKYITSLQYFQYALASSSADTGIKLWDLRTGQCHRTLLGHQGNVNSFQFDEMKVISGSTDKSLKVWDLRTGECVNTLAVGSPVNILRFDEKSLIVGSDKNIKVFNIETYSFVQKSVLSGHTGNVTALKFMGNALISGSTDTSLRIWCI